MTTETKKGAKRGPKRKYSLTPQEFESLRVILDARGWARERQQIAELYLVESMGFTLKQIADMYGITHQAVSDFSRRAWEIYQRFIAKTDDGYVRVVTTAPAELAKDFQRRVAIAKTDAREASKSEKKPASK